MLVADKNNKEFLCEVVSCTYFLKLNLKSGDNI